MTRSPVRIPRWIALAGGAFLLAAVAVALPEPGEFLSTAEVEKIMGGKFEPRTVEPGVVFYEEKEGSRQVQVFVAGAEGRRLASLRQHLVEQGEPVDDIPALGETGFYRPQRNEIALEKALRGGELAVVSIGVWNVEDPARTKKLATELASAVAAKP